MLSAPAQALVIERPDDPRSWMEGYLRRENGGPGGSPVATGGRGEQQADGSRRRKTPAPARSWAAPRPPPPSPPSTTETNTTTAGATNAHGERVEADTEAPEEIPDLNSLLLPSGALPIDVERFGVSYSAALLAGWVKQVGCEDGSGRKTAKPWHRHRTWPSLTSRLFACSLSLAACMAPRRADQSMVGGTEGGGRSEHLTLACLKKKRSRDLKP